MRVLITGASRGLGLEFARQLAERGETVIATCRTPQTAADLAAIQAAHPDRVTVLPLDVSDPASVDAMVEAVSGQVDVLDLLINNAGISAGMEPLAEFSQDSLLRLMTVNAAGPLLVAKGLLPLLQKGSKVGIVNLSSGLGSIGRRAESGFYSYAASKAALDMLTRTLANDSATAGIPVIVMDPGWVQTDMGGPNAWITPQESIGGMLKVIDGLTAADTGRFLHYTGEEIPW